MPKSDSERRETEVRTTVRINEWVQDIYLEYAKHTGATGRLLSVSEGVRKAAEYISREAMQSPYHSREKLDKLCKLLEPESDETIDIVIGMVLSTLEVAAIKARAADKK